VAAPLEAWVLALIAQLGPEALADLCTRVTAMSRERGRLKVVGANGYRVTPPDGRPWEVAPPPGGSVIVPPGLRLDG
jgi:hypothetical protein